MLKMAVDSTEIVKDIKTNYSHPNTFEVMMYYNYYNKVFGESAEVIIISIYTLLIFFGILSNLFIISIIVFNAKLRKFNNILLINLLFTNISICMFNMPITLFTIIRKDYIFGQFMCNIFSFVQEAFVFACSSTIASIALERLSKITSNKIRGNRFNNCDDKKPIITILKIWSLSILLALPVCFFQKLVKYKYDLYTFHKCEKVGLFIHLYSVIITVGQLIMPVVVISICNRRIESHLINFTRKRKKKPKVIINGEISSSAVSKTESGNTINLCINPSDFIENSQSNFSGTQNACCTQRHAPIIKEIKRNERVNRLLILMATTFCLSWFFLNAFKIVNDLFGPSHLISAKNILIIFTICHVIAMTTPITNAILYGFLHTEIEKQIIRYLSRIGCVNQH